MTVKKQRRNAAARAEQAIAKAIRSITEAGWVMSTPEAGGYVATKTIHEREDDSVTRLFESDITVEGLAALVARREREEKRA